MMPQKVAIDAGIGVSGTTAWYWLQHVDMVLAILIGLVGLVLITLRTLITWREWRRKR